MIAPTRVERDPSFLQAWPVAFPHRSKPWTLRDGQGRWAAYDPESDTVVPLDPGVDPALPGLRTALGRGQLVGYRHQRRAVVATGDSYVKVVRPRRAPGLVDLHRTIGAAVTSVTVPAVASVGKDGCVELAPVPGRSLHELLRIGDSSLIDAALDRIGLALAGFHSTPVDETLPEREPDAATSWVSTVARVEPPFGRLAQTATALPSLPPVERRLVHGDLHDKNVFVHGSGVAMIDLDGAGRGAAEDDLANLTVHLRLRSLQAGTGDAEGRRRATRLRRAYETQRDIDAERFEAAERLTWFRLACLYRYRRASRHLVPELMSRAGSVG